MRVSNSRGLWIFTFQRLALGQNQVAIKSTTVTARSIAEAIGPRFIASIQMSSQYLLRPMVVVGRCSKSSFITCKLRILRSVRRQLSGGRNDFGQVLGLLRRCFSPCLRQGMLHRNAENSQLKNITLTSYGPAGVMRDWCPAFHASSGKLAAKRSCNFYEY